MFTSRAALETWKQRLGSSATYNNLIGVFERAGYQDYADTVRRVIKESLTSSHTTLEPAKAPDTRQRARKKCIIS